MEHREMYIKSESGREKAMGEKGRGRKRNTKKEKRRERERRERESKRNHSEMYFEREKEREREREGHGISRLTPSRKQPVATNDPTKKTIMVKL